MVFSDVVRTVGDLLWTEAEVGVPAGSSSAVRLSGGVLEVLQFGFVTGVKSSWETRNKSVSDERCA